MPPRPKTEASKTGNSTMPPPLPFRIRKLVLVLGDQFRPQVARLGRLRPHDSAVWMVEVADDSTHFGSQEAHIAVFLAAMRHYRDAIRQRAIPVL
jgi:deoxyribodipyrimidine photolyase-related protein